MWSWLVSAHAAANNGPVSECSAPSTPVRRAAICPACTACAWRKRTHSARAVRDAELKTQISRVHADSFFGVDGARKVWRQPPAPTGGWSERVEPPPTPERFTLPPQLWHVHNQDQAMTVGGRVADSGIPVALVGLGGAVVGAAAVALASKLTGDATFNSALLSQLNSYQAGLTNFCNPYVAAGFRLQPVLSGATPEVPWLPLMPELPNIPPPWAPMCLNPQRLFQFPHEMRRKAHYLDERIPAHQARFTPFLDPLTHGMVQQLHGDTAAVVDLYTREFNELLKRGLGVR